MSLREIFFSQLRDRFYVTLKGTLLRDWRPEIISSLIDEVTSEKMYEINSYIQNNVVTLENMNQHIQRIIESILLPHIYRKRVE